MKWPQHNQFEIKDATILAGYMGSQSHGTYVPPQQGGIDDKDVMGICVPPSEFYFGLKEFAQLDTWVDEYDIVIYEIRKFVRLLLKNNPNVLGLLWLPDNLYIKKTDLGQLLIDNREIFSSKQAYKSFTGYAYSQLKKMENCKHEGYMGEKRKALVKKFGYDTKNAAHLIRLLRMGTEFLATGEVNVLRHDASQLIDIKLGKYSLEQIKDLASRLFEKAEKALIHSDLPNKPNEKKAEELLLYIIKQKVHNEKF